MVYCFHLRLKAVVIGAASLMLLILPTIGEGQTLPDGQVLRGPDLGLWFRQERDASERSVLIVDHLLDDGPFASAGLREGDRLVSVDGQPIDSEPQFMRRMTSSIDADHEFRLIVTRTVPSGTVPGGEVQEQTISLKTRDVWKAAVVADPFYQAGFLVDESHRDGVVVLRVFPLTPAFYAGLREGDVITSVRGQSVTSPADVPQYFRVGGKLALGVTRSGELRQLFISLPSRRTMAATTYPPSSGVQPLPPSAPILPPPPLLIPPPIVAPTFPHFSAAGSVVNGPRH
jgi:S1-C subfamily serine protease